jgi:hypothetical protein
MRIFLRNWEELKRQAYRQGAGGQEAGRQEAWGQEARGQEAGGQEAWGQEAGGQEAGGEEAGGQEAWGQETGGQEAGGQEAGIHEAWWQKAGRQGAGRQDTEGWNQGKLELAARDWDRIRITWGNPQSGCSDICSYSKRATVAPYIRKVWNQEGQVSRKDRKQGRPKAGKTGSREEQEAGKTEGRMAWSRKTNKQFENVYCLVVYITYFWILPHN